MTEAARDATRAAIRVALGPAITLGIYLVVLRGFDAVTEDDGLLKPGAAPDLGIVALGLLALALRLVVVFALPISLAYYVASRALAALALRDRGRDPGAPIS